MQFVININGKAAKLVAICGVIVFVLAALCVPMIGWSQSGGTFVIPNVFVNGEVADAVKVNANFKMLADAVNKGLTDLDIQRLADYLVTSHANDLRGLKGDKGEKGDSGKSPVYWFAPYEDVLTSVPANSYVKVIELPVTVPSNGTVHVQAGVTSFFSVYTDLLELSILTNDDHLYCFNYAYAAQGVVEVGTPGKVVNNYEWAPRVVQASFRVKPGSYVFNLRARNMNHDSTCKLSNPTMTATFYPD